MLMILIIGFFLIPLIVYAEEELPTEGVHYFLTYPTGEEVITADYEEATDLSEKLIYTGTTNSEGKIVIGGLSSEGKLRIVQKVPAGYSVEVQEITLDLAGNNRNVEFVDVKNGAAVVNPKTGQSIGLIFLVVTITVSAILIVKSNYKKQLLLLVPVVIAVVAFKAMASTSDVVIVIKDREGHTLSGIEVEVYADPKIEAAPTVKFNANNGTFFDGTELIYMKIPQNCANPCTVSSFMSNLSEKEYGYLRENILGAHREGYSASNINYPETLTNGTELQLNWVEDSSVRLVTIDGNGGTYDFYGNKLSTITGYNYKAYQVAYGFHKDNQYSVGADDNSNCIHYNENGMPDTTAVWNTDATVVYACWKNRPDGIYVNGKLFLGNDTTCYSQSYLLKNNNTIDLQFNNYEIEFTEISSTSVSLSRLMKQKTVFLSNNSSGAARNNLALWTQLKEISARRTEAEYEYSDIESFEIIKNGEVFLSLTNGDINKEENEFVVTNEEKLNSLYTYLNGLLTNC